MVKNGGRASPPGWMGETPFLYRAQTGRARIKVVFGKYRRQAKAFSPADAFGARRPDGAVGVSSRKSGTLKPEPGWRLGANPGFEPTESRCRPSRKRYWHWNRSIGSCRPRSPESPPTSQRIRLRPVPDHPAIYFAATVPSAPSLGQPTGLASEYTPSHNYWQALNSEFKSAIRLAAVISTANSPNVEIHSTKVLRLQAIVFSGKS
jgi:hypothetical protein